MTTSWLLVALLAASAAHAEDAKEPAEVLRQRLAERLSTQGGAAAPAKPPARPAKAPAKPAKPVHWGYTGDIGPDRWAELAPDNKRCAVGTRQSPIDIRDGIAVDLEKIAFDYRASGFTVQDTGHTVQVNVAPGNGLTVMGRRYELVQFHFHRPSEERVNGRQFEMVAHLEYKDAQGRLAIVAVLLERGDALAAQGQLDLTQLLPANRGYYTYMGSQTTPPCEEGVLWMVMRQPVQLTAQQIGVFARLYPMNARPLQAGSGRLIKESQ